MISRFFIDRPVFAAVISIVIVIAGLVAMFHLPIDRYPDIMPPQIQVTATYPGANADVVSQNVAAPIELQVNGADNMLYMSSTNSATGDMRLSVFFEIGTNPALAQVDVQNRVNLALPTLPEVVQRQGVKVEKRSMTFLMLIAIYSPDGRYDSTFIDNYANLYVLDAIKRIPGANQTGTLGIPDYAMRIWLKPDRMAQLGITASDVARAVAEQNQQFAAGRVGQPPTESLVQQTFPVVTKGRLTTPGEFEDIILRATGDAAALVRLKDVARAELGSKDYSVRSKINGKTSRVVAVFQQPGSNALEVSDLVHKAMVELKKTFPEGLDYVVALDTTKFIRSSIREVVLTLFEALVLVVLVVFLFLGSFRATLIPILAVPVSIIGTFLGMMAFGFTINMLTLFGLVLAIGIVVDDAIVVIENVERNMTRYRLSPKEAARRAMDEVTGPVIAIVLVLVAVFVPVAFLGGMTGQLYKQFAVTIAVSVTISGIVALTLSPALAALLLRPGEEERKKRFFRWFDKTFERVTEGYASGVRLAIKRVVVALAVFAVMLLLAGGLFRAVPTSFVPPEDQGYIFAASGLPDAASLDRTERVAERVRTFFREEKAVENIMESAGFSILDLQYKTNAATAFVALKDYDERKGKDMQAPAVMASLARKFSTIKEAVVFPMNPPSIPGLGAIGGFEFWIQSRGEGDTTKLEAVTRDFIAKAGKRPELRSLTSTIRAASQQLKVDVDREKAESLGVPVGDVYDALQTVFGSLYVSQFNRYSRLWQVIVQAESKYRIRPDDVEQIYVRSRKGNMVPLKAVIMTSYVTGPDLVPRFNGFPAAKVIGDAAPGYSSGQAIAAMEQVARQLLPHDFAFEWAGQAYQEKKSGGASAAIFVFGLIMVFLILAAQYERWTLPFAILMAVPFAVFGALLSIWLRGIENDIFFQIGLLTLIGLAAKNAILIVEFAAIKRREGLPIVEAAVEAAKLRLRPIIMTSLAFILGCVPLAIATGASANSRHSIGTGVIGGMLGATLIAIFFIPLFFCLLEGAREKLRRGNPLNLESNGPTTSFESDSGSKTT